MLSARKSTLENAAPEMPEFIAITLRRTRLVEAYAERPPYQQNGYIDWITRAKLDVTRQKRLKQMISELYGGKLYMNMPYRPQRE